MRLTLMSLSFMLFSFVQGQVRKLSAETNIQNVTIFTSGARVERTATVNLPEGRTELSFAGLSNQLDQQTVQLKADANITLLAVQTTKDFLTERKVAAMEQDFIDHINAVKDKLELDQKTMEVIRNEKEILQKNQSIGGDAGVKMVDLKEVLDFQKQRLTDLYIKELEIQKRISIEQQEIKKTETQLREFSKKKDSINYIVTALVDSKQTRTVKFQLFYNVTDAGWFPTYDVRVQEVGEPLGILMNANVFQRSGETWKNIPLLLSTGNPNDNATPSRLQPWMLGFNDPSVSYTPGYAPSEISGRITNENGEPVPYCTVTVKGTRMATTADANGFFKIKNVPRNSVLSLSGIGLQSKEVVAAGGYFTIKMKTLTQSLNEVVVSSYAAGLSSENDAPAAARKLKEENIQLVSVSTQEQPTTVVYRIEEKYTLESDGKTTTIAIKQMDIPAQYDYYTAPKVDPAAFLTARIISWQDYGLQSGEASLYFEGSYLGKTYIDLNTIEDTLSLALGKDNGIKISRKIQKEYSSKKFIGSNRTDSKLFEISVRNSKAVPVHLILVDQIPVSTTKEISVEDVSAPEAQIDKETGIVTWSLNLSPGQDKKMALGYSVKYPKDRKLNLN